VRHSAIICSTVALMALGTAGVASAQSKSYDQNVCPPGQDCPQDMRRSSDDIDDGMTKKRRIRVEDSADVKVEKSVTSAQSDWRFDSNRHERRRKKDDRFRFFFGGFWYPEPYWSYGLVVRPRIGCREGREILFDRGFRRVRVVECAGRTYTYIGRRHGDPFRILLSARSGRIVDVDPI
jgi:hypothetical protein